MAGRDRLSEHLLEIVDGEIQMAICNGHMGMTRAFLTRTHDINYMGCSWNAIYSSLAIILFWYDGSTAPLSTRSPLSHESHAFGARFHLG